VQFQKPGRTKCVRCGQELVIVERAPEEPKKPEILYPHDEYVRRLENSVCFVLKTLRTRAHLQQKEVAERGHFGARSYVSKVENPMGLNRTIPTMRSLEKFGAALNVEPWKIVAMAEKEAGREERNEWLDWWFEMLPLLKQVRRKDQNELLVAARRLGSKKRLPARTESDRV